MRNRPSPLLLRLARSLPARPSASWLLTLTAVALLALAPALAQAGDEPEAGEATPTEGEVAPAPSAEQVDEAGPVEDLSSTGELLWSSLVHSRVELSLSDGAKLFGRVLTQAPDEIALILDQDGFVMRVPKDSILRIRVLEQADGIEVVREEVAEKVQIPPNGQAPIIAGALVTATGGGMLTVFLVGSAIDSYFAYDAYPLAIIGGWTLGSGIPILITGLALRDMHEDWEKEAHPPTPELALRVGAGTAGLTITW
jgi:hypothetical protein